MCWGKSRGKLYGNAVALKKLNFCVLRHTRWGSGRRAWWAWLVVRLVCRLGKQLNKLPQGAASLSYIYALHASYTSLCVCVAEWAPATPISFLSISHARRRRHCRCEATLQVTTLLPLHTHGTCTSPGELRVSDIGERGKGEAGKQAYFE